MNFKVETIQYQDHDWQLNIWHLYNFQFIFPEALHEHRAWIMKEAQLSPWIFSQIFEKNNAIYVRALPWKKCLREGQHSD